ncbi:ejaculatory bulb-specific protein 3-like [Schistocerca cancellata]|uniref:ejaculatory bulb-specific protein 3-like n=1 Tax=Schistocerca cancellata TaxID=274614 RepID=UPI002119238C|nr:ejaculatory bulb-specific protein 3-like [Schistocerca cancellata]
MKASLLPLLVAVAAVASTVLADNPDDLPHFGTQDDISPLLHNKELVQAQINCVLHNGHCDKLGIKLKKAIPEVITNKCRKCSPRQKANAEKLKNFLLKHHPGVWEAVIRKYTKRGAH